MFRKMAVVASVVASVVSLVFAFAVTTTLPASAAPAALGHYCDPGHGCPPPPCPPKHHCCPPNDNDRDGKGKGDDHDDDDSDDCKPPPCKKNCPPPPCTHDCQDCSHDDQQHGKSKSKGKDDHDCKDKEKDKGNSKSGSDVKANKVAFVAKTPPQNSTAASLAVKGSILLLLVGAGLLRLSYARQRKVRRQA